MLFLLLLLTVAYFAVVLWVARTRRSGPLATGTGLATVADLPEDDQPPVTAVGWPPGGSGFTTYVDEGFDALDAYLSEGAA